MAAREGAAPGRANRRGDRAGDGPEAAVRAGAVAHSEVFCINVVPHFGQLNLPPGFGGRPRFLPAPAGATPAGGQPTAPGWNMGNGGGGLGGRPPEPDVGGADGSEAVARSSAGQLYTPSCCRAAAAAAAAGAPPPPPPPGAAGTAAAAAGCCCAACRAASTAKTSDSEVGATEPRLHLECCLGRYGRSGVLHGAEMGAVRRREELCWSELRPSCTNRQPAIAEEL